MSVTILYIVIGMLAVAGLALQLAVARRRHNRDHRNDLEPILAAHGLTFVAARWPGIFKVGPFPQFEIEVGRPQSRLGGIRGEYDTYRVVSARDSNGNLHALWARIEFEGFRLRRISWRSKNEQNLPSPARRILDN